MFGEWAGGLPPRPHTPRPTAFDNASPHGIGFYISYVQCYTTR